MPAITVTDLNNAKQDTDTIAGLAISQAPTITDRLGNVKSTAFAAVQSLKAFNVRGVWATATAYALKDVYTFGGYAYVVVTAHTSTTVAADLASGYVTIHQGATKEDLAASSGAGLVGYALPVTNGLARTAQEKLSEQFNVFDFLTVAEKADVTARTLLVDVTASVQKAINASSGRRLVWPTGSLLITKCLNASGRGSSATIWMGQGFDTDMSSGTIIVGRTAGDGTLSPGWISDFTGSQNITLEELNFWGAGTSKSTYGLLFARTAAFQYAQQVALKKVCVKIASAPVGGTVGSIAVANNQAEQFKTDHCAFYGDVPFAGMLNNNLSVVSPYQVISSAIPSATALQFAATTFYAYTQPSVILWGIASANWDNSCVFARDSGNSTQYAIDIRSGGIAYNYPHALNIKGQVEGFPGGVSFSTASMSVYNVKTELFMVTFNAAAVVTAANVTLFNCEFDNSHPQNIPGNYNLSCGTGNVLYGGKIVTYPGDFGVAGSPALYGAEIAQDASGRGLRGLAAGTNVNGLGAPNGSQTNITNDGYVYISGILQATGVVAAGATIATIDPIHCPNRTVYGSLFVSGVGTAYCLISPAGAISIGAALVSGSQVCFDAFSFKRLN